MRCAAVVHERNGLRAVGSWRVKRRARVAARVQAHAWGCGARSPEMTSPREVRLLLMNLASSSALPLTWLSLIRSDPARSTKLSSPSVRCSAASLTPVILRRKRKCEREDWSLDLVDEVERTRAAASRCVCSSAAWHWELQGRQRPGPAEGCTAASH